MPWKVDKVDEHKKGLTDEQKKKWVATANSTLKSCMDKGGTEKECAGKAIKIANGIITTQGGSGSGNFGHEGRPGEVGGSEGGGGGSEVDYDYFSAKSIIKQTSSGKAIYMNKHANNKVYNDFTPEEHKEAAKAHAEVEYSLKQEDFKSKATFKAIKQQHDAMYKAHMNMAKYGQVSADLQTHSQKNKDYEIRTETHQKKKYIVVPVVMMVEGVHNGSRGAVLHTAEEMSKITESWNGIPIVIFHPENDGLNISANSPGVIDNQAVGRVYNTYMDGGALKAEAWLDEEKLNEISPEAYVHITEKKALEVSVGVFTEDQEEIGEYNNEKYIAIATNYRPDHLALLPGGVGACSWNDGCGIRVNKEGGNNGMIRVDDLKKPWGSLNLAGYSVSQIGDHAEQGYNEKLRLVYDAIRGLDGKDSYNYLEEMYDDYLIYQHTQNGESKMYKQFYLIKDNNIEFIGEPVSVKKKVEYVTFERKINNNQNKGDKNMAEDAKKPCGQCMEKIVALIANEQTQFTEADREWLLTQDEATLDKLIPKKLEVNNAKPEKVHVLSDEDKADLAWAKQMRKEKRRKLIEGIQANVEKGTWSDEELNVMNENILEKIFSSVKKEVIDYSLSGNPILDNSVTEDDVLTMPGVEIKK
jgi:hypothetical protein